MLRAAMCAAFPQLTQKVRRPNTLDKKQVIVGEHRTPEVYPIDLYAFYRVDQISNQLVVIINDSFVIATKLLLVNGYSGT